MADKFTVKVHTYERKAPSRPKYCVETPQQLYSPLNEVH